MVIMMTTIDARVDDVTVLSLPGVCVAKHDDDDDGRHIDDVPGDGGEVDVITRPPPPHPTPPHPTPPHPPKKGSMKPPKSAKTLWSLRHALAKTRWNRHLHVLQLYNPSKTKHLLHALNPPKP